MLAGDLVPEQLQEHVRHHYAVWRQAAERVRALDLSLGDSARERRDAVKRLETVPGVGPIVALTAIAVFAEVSRFESAKHAASYAGLVPSTFQSGERDVQNFSIEVDDLFSSSKIHKTAFVIWPAAT
jgi:transposase